MEWIVVEAITVEVAKELALDQLGVDENEAEFEIVAEPSISLLGLRKKKAQVRASIAPRPAPEYRKGRFRKQRGQGSKSRQSSFEAKNNTKRSSARIQPSGKTRDDRTSTTGKPKNSRERKPMTEITDDGVMQDDEQQKVARSFVEGAVHAFDPQAVVNVSSRDGILHLDVESNDPGLMIGSKGATLAALEDLLHVCIRRSARGRRYSRVRLDIGGYRRLRKERLEDFARKVAKEVCEVGEAMAFEPMNSLDRKIVHDAAMQIDGVQTRSEGEDPRRRVVVFPVD